MAERNTHIATGDTPSPSDFPLKRGGIVCGGDNFPPLQGEG